MVFIDTPFESISNALEISNGLFVVAGTNSVVDRHVVDAGLWISDNTLLPAEREEILLHALSNPNSLGAPL